MFDRAPNSPLLNLLNLKWHEWWSVGIIINFKYTNLVMLFLNLIDTGKSFFSGGSIGPTFHYILDVRKLLKEGGCCWRRVVTLAEEPINLALAIRVCPFVCSTVFSGFAQYFLLIFCMKLVFNQHLKLTKRIFEKNSYCA